MRTVDELYNGFKLGEWQILPAQGVMQRGDEVVRPENIPFKVLLSLAQRDGDLVSKDQLIEEVWDGRAQGDDPILRAISVLRGYFGDQKPFKYVENIPKRGYRLVPRVELIEALVDQIAPPRIEERPLRRWQGVTLATIVGFVVIATLTWAPPPPKSLAILKIENLSGDPNLDYAAEGTQYILVQRLAELPDLLITNSRTDYAGDWVAIARELGVESLFHATMQFQDETLKFVYTIVNGKDGVVLESGEVSGPMANLFAVQERLARAIHDELGGADTPELITKQAPAPVAYDSYVRGVYAIEHRFDEGNLEEAIRLFRECIRLDASFGPAYLGLATAYALLPEYRGADLAEQLRLAVATIDNGISLDSSIEDAGGAIYGFASYQQKSWQAAEANYLRAVGAQVVDSNAFSWYAMMLAGVGRLEAARDVALGGVMLDPDNPVLNGRLAMVYTWLDNTIKAHEYFERANELGAKGEMHVLAHALLLLRSGQIEMSRNLAFRVVSVARGATDWIDPFYRAVAEPSAANIIDALASIDGASADLSIYPGALVIGRTMLGDIDGAMDVALLLEEPGMVFPMEILFIPELSPLRQHPQFLPLLERLGVLDYLEKVGCRWEMDRVRCDA